ncbi:hypothetical protein [Streptomyces sp. AK02-01A]|uniref:hypothetical protein n=1 Tax=Streptomyces sp. AK02-01A TaxID=3028648 RepID=UPI0029A8A72B|nr:hypothetical protein [Streptomyces sp. AK02-01A]MDX3853019.1 hypothetical protein [Streptomyces sp. AK02-01A]
MPGVAGQAGCVRQGLVVELTSASKAVFQQTAKSPDGPPEKLRRVDLPARWFVLARA